MFVVPFFVESTARVLRSQLESQVQAAVMGKTVAQARAVGGNANAALWGLRNDLPISRCLPTFVIPGRQHRLFNEVPVVVSD